MRLRTSAVPVLAGHVVAGQCASVAVAVLVRPSAVLQQFCSVDGCDRAAGRRGLPRGHPFARDVHSAACPRAVDAASRARLQLHHSARHLPDVDRRSADRRPALLRTPVRRPELHHQPLKDIHISTDGAQTFALIAGMGATDAQNAAAAPFTALDGAIKLEDSLGRLYLLGGNHTSTVQYSDDGLHCPQSRRRGMAGPTRERWPTRSAASPCSVDRACWTTHRASGTT